jgi:hypothetical protein
MAVSCILDWNRGMGQIAMPAEVLVEQRAESHHVDRGVFHGTNMVVVEPSQSYLLLP